MIAPVRPSPGPPEPRTQPPAPPDELYERFLRGEAGADPDHLAYLDKGIDSSPYRHDLALYPARLEQSTGVLADYPGVGEIPRIDPHGLDFLPAEITQACVCVAAPDGSTRWLGRRALDNVQQWSSTKLVPILEVAAQADRADPTVALGGCIVRDPTGVQPSLPFPQVVDDIVSYRRGDSASNQEARMLKDFSTPRELEAWLQGITGNHGDGFEFRGGYGEPAYIADPELVNAGGKPVLEASGAQHRGNNLVSAYDLCRMISETGWHEHLPSDARLPQVRWDSLKSIVAGLGADSARYADVGLEALGLADRVKAPVIISKLGYGYSDLRHTWEMVYVALVQFTVNDRPVRLAMALRGARDARPGSHAALELDARMAATVAHLLQRAVAGTLAQVVGKPRRERVGKVGTPTNVLGNQVRNARTLRGTW